MPGASVEEVAARLSESEGRAVTVGEVRMIEARALRKLRRTLIERGLDEEALWPDLRYRASSMQRLQEE